MPGAPSPVGTPVQGHKLSQDPPTSTSDRTPRSNVPTRPEADDISAAASSTSTISRPMTPLPARGQRSSTGPGSPITQHSPLRQSVSYTEFDDEPFPSPSGHKRPTAAKMGLTGDTRARKAREDRHHQAQTGARYTQRGRPAAQQAGASAATPFSFFASPMSTLKGLTSPSAALPQADELISLDIEAALFPSGPPAEGDAFSPAAFKNLHMNAAGVLRKFQTAYQSQTMALQELKAEQEAQDDERIEVTTRTQHLKMQLEEMAQQAVENEAIMQALMEELKQEKQLRLKERQAREKSVAPSDMSTVSEDLGVEEDQRRRARRRSGETSKSDLSSDTDEESIEEASVFSRSRSPTITASMSDTTAPDTSQPPLPPLQLTKSTTLVPPRAAKQSQPQMSAFQKLFRGMSTEPPKADGPRGAYSCRNCQGQDASVAWDTVSLLRDENRGLKQRVGELETAVDEALDAVIGFGLNDTIRCRKAGP